MKKLFLSFIAIIAIGFSAQAQTEEGMKFLEINTGFGQGVGGTGFSYTSIDDDSAWNIGAEGGLFVVDDLAIKAGLGFGGGKDESSVFSYKLGAKYYIQSVAPVEISLSGSSIEDYDENPMWLGFQGGYGIFVADNVSIEPGLRYNLSLNEDFTDEGLFQGNIGFVFFFE